MWPLEGGGEETAVRKGRDRVLELISRRILREKDFVVVSGTHRARVRKKKTEEVSHSSFDMSVSSAAEENPLRWEETARETKGGEEAGKVISATQVSKVNFKMAEVCGSGSSESISFLKKIDVC